MTKTVQNRVLKWIFAGIAAGAFTAAGIFIGKMSILGATPGVFLRMACFGVLGIMMFWGALRYQGERS